MGLEAPQEKAICLKTVKVISNKTRKRNEKEK